MAKRPRVAAPAPRGAHSLRNVLRNAIFRELTALTLEALMQRLAAVGKLPACLADRGVVIAALVWLSEQDLNPLLTYDPAAERITSMIG